MTLREKLADWLTGGALQRHMDAHEEWYDEWYRESNMRRGYCVALHSIASIPVTRNSNGQTRKAVRIAKEALE